MRACRCPCHQSTVGDLRDAEQREDSSAVRYYATDDHLALPPFVDVGDELEALVAQGCSCRAYHFALRSFVTPPPKAIPPHLMLPPPNPFDPNADSQSDGGSDDDGN